MNKNISPILLIVIVTILISIVALNGETGGDHEHDEHQHETHAHDQKDEEHNHAEKTGTGDHTHDARQHDEHEHDEHQHDQKDDEHNHAEKTGTGDHAHNAHKHEEHELDHDEHEHAQTSGLDEHDEHTESTSINDRVAAESGVGVAIAGSAVVHDMVEVTGTVQAAPSGISEVRARFPGLVKKVFRDFGDQVRAGDALAVVESNESLRDYEVRAPIDGLIVDRNLQVGQVAADEPLYRIVNLSNVWVQLDVLGRSAARIETGQRVRIVTLDGLEFEGMIEWLSPLVAHGSQSQRARVPLPNPEQRIRPGQFVRGIVTVAATEVPLAVRTSALQTMRNTEVVFQKIGTTYAARAIEIGRRDNEYVEVLAGLESGAAYVSENSYLIKADIEKAGASHDH